MSKKIDAMNDRVDLLERWKWMIVGGAVAMGYLISHINLLDKFL
jgi:hypothetical protein